MKSKLIPNIIHQIWFQGEDKIPELHKKYQKICKNMYKDWEYMFWDDHKIQDLIQSNYSYLYKYYIKYPTLLQKVDLARYIILYHYGGCYIDMDVECIKSINELLEKNPYKTFICSKMPFNLWFSFKWFQYKKYINNGIFLCSKNNHITKQLINESTIKNSFERKWYHIVKEMYISSSISIDYFNVIINKNINDNKLLILDNKYFEPSSFGTNTHKESYFNHHHQLSWFSKNTSIIVKFLIKYQYIIFSILIIILILLIFKKYNYTII